MIRSLLPIDVVALIFFNLRTSPNQAKPRDQLVTKGKGSLLLGAFLKQGLPSKKKRHTLVCIRRGRIQGLLSARSRSGPSAWEIDRLLLAGSNNEDVCLHLLEEVSGIGGRSKSEKIFLRLPANSPLVDVAVGAGFSHYVTEYLYQSAAKTKPEQNLPPLTLRQKSSNDEYGLFRLYSATVPAPIRSAEGMTFREWLESREWSGKEFIYEKDGKLLGWLRISTDRLRGHFDIMVHPSEANSLDYLVKYSLGLLHSKHLIICLTPEFQLQLQRLLLEHNFKEMAEYSTLVKQLAVRQTQLDFAPKKATGWEPALPFSRENP